jgi:hypothetical protein
MRRNAFVMAKIRIGCTNQSSQRSMDGAPPRSFAPVIPVVREQRLGIARGTGTRSSRI